MIRVLTFLSVLILGLSAAEAKIAATIQGGIGLGGQADADNLDSENLESDFMLMGTVEFLSSRTLWIGGRLAYTSATGNDTENEYTTVDAGVWARFVLMPGKTEVFAAGGLAASFQTIDVDGTTTDAEGTGLNVMLGGGASFPISRQMRVIGGLYYSYTSGEPEAEAGGQTFKVEEGVLNRFYLTAGVAF